MADNSSLGAARNAKNDEFYTQYSDIEAEMNAYIEYNPEVFKDKTILLPCDDPEWSNFTKYFASNFTRLGIKKLISTSYAQGAANKQPTIFELMSPLYNPQQHDTHGKLFTLTRDTDGNGTVDTDDIEFTGYLEGDGDFRSSEVKKLRDEADIIITNPPFSLFREFLAWILEADKQFVILGNMNAITYKEVFPYLQDNAIWIGYKSLNQDMYFNVTDDYKNWLTHNKKEGSAYKIVNGIVMGRLASACWFTNIDHGKRHENLILDTMEHNLKFNKKLKKKLEKDYGKLEYPHYDNYDAIEVPFTECIPSDYDGVMGVPITFMDKYNPDQFDIVAFRKGEDGKDLVFTREREYNRTFASLYNVDSRDDKERRRKDKWASYLRENNNHPQKTPVEIIFPLATNLQNGLINDCTIDGKKTYVRMLIQKNRGN
ncbi:adenine-specific methyltransferase EcoRI family protein [Fannyhessea vaginae]|uniref:adenine-specific methyltransferase EcoRI family protein n=1 Tax=Fannyhessea vaginae TaxID=82135 RepID=UPI00288BCA38|nr:adenine-specific methyltransferase EcoRI family protein [Fannyhessea vaginae]